MISLGYGLQKETYFRAFVTIALHLETLAQIHQAFVDLSSFGQCGTGGLRVPGTLGTYQCEIRDVVEEVGRTKISCDTYRLGPR